MGVEVAGITKRFGALVAVDGVDLVIARGELLAVVGPSGCGKTTLIRIIAGLERPDAGEVRIGGRTATHLPPERRNVSIVFQNFALFPHMSVADNVAYGLKMRSFPRSERERRVNEALELVDLAGLGRRRPHELSAGQQQRVALARALAPRPHTLLLDEPLSALDASLRERLRLEIRRIQRELGITTILVTHDQEEALSIADRVAVMERGALVQVGEPWEVYDSPASPFVAGFIGKGSFVEAEVGGDGADLGPLGRVPKERLPGHIEPGPALAFVRPEFVRVEPADSGSQAALEFTATLLEVSFSGHICSLHLRAGGRPILATAPGHESPRFRAAVGNSLRLRVPLDALRWFQ